jgi:signal transduction histidine kinase
LFDAFFTTRSHGTGVGLAVVKRIADEHGFHIDVTSGEGRGATFRVRLKTPE